MSHQRVDPAVIERGAPTNTATIAPDSSISYDFAEGGEGGLVGSTSPGLVTGYPALGDGVQVRVCIWMG